MIQMREQEKRGIAANMYTSKAGSNSNDKTEEEISVGAGIINMLLTEQDFIEVEKTHIEKFETIVRNLNDVEKTTTTGVKYTEMHNLSYAELKFLGF